MSFKDTDPSFYCFRLSISVSNLYNNYNYTHKRGNHAYDKISIISQIHISKGLSRQSHNLLVSNINCLGSDLHIYCVPLSLQM
jgi:hypothetical protein